MPESFRVVCIPYKALYKCSDLPLPLLPFITGYFSKHAACTECSFSSNVSTTIDYYNHNIDYYNHNIDYYNHNIDYYNHNIDYYNHIIDLSNIILACCSPLMLFTTRNTFCGTWYLAHSQVHNERTVPIIMAGCIVHARNGQISTSALKSYVTIMFLNPDFL